MPWPGGLAIDGKCVGVTAIVAVRCQWELLLSKAKVASYDYHAQHRFQSLHYRTRAHHWSLSLSHQMYHGRRNAIASDGVF
jgi:hypothetical protein